MRVLVLLLCSFVPIAHADTTVDWAAGRIAVTAAAAADLRAPSPQIARVAAERSARGRARGQLLVAVRTLPWAGGGTLGQRADADPEVLRALDLAVDGADTDELRIQSDGSVVVRLGTSLDALVGLTPTTESPRLVVDGKGHVKPALGYRLVAGDESYVGPLRFGRGGRSRTSVTRVKGDEVVLPAGALEHVASPVLILVGE